LKLLCGVMYWNVFSSLMLNKDKIFKRNNNNNNNKDIYHFLSQLFKYLSQYKNWSQNRHSQWLSSAHDYGEKGIIPADIPTLELVYTWSEGFRDKKYCTWSFYMRRVFIVLNAVPKSLMWRRIWRPRH
jgi:hypothetical protein